MKTIIFKNMAQVKRYYYNHNMYYNNSHRYHIHAPSYMPNCIKHTLLISAADKAGVMYCYDCCDARNKIYKKSNYKMVLLDDNHEVKQWL